MVQPAAGIPRSGASTSPRPGSDHGRLPSEGVRKLIHIASVAIPVAVWYSPRPLAITIVGLIVLVALLVEWARMQIRWARYHFLLSTRRLLRRRERHGLAGATYMALGYLLATVIFPRPIAVAAMLYIAIGDAVAALVGKHWGRHRTASGKSWEGAFAAFAANSAIGIMLPGIPQLASVAGAAAAALIEMAPLPFNDNLTVALGGGGMLWLMVAMMG